MILLMKGIGGSCVFKYNLVSIIFSGNIELGIMFIENVLGGMILGVIFYLFVIGEGGDYVLV